MPFLSPRGLPDVKHSGDMDKHFTKASSQTGISLIMWDTLINSTYHLGMVNIAPTFTEFGDGLLFAFICHIVYRNDYEETEETIETLQITSPYVFVSFSKSESLTSEVSRRKASRRSWWASLPRRSARRRRTWLMPSWTVVGKARQITQVNGIYRNAAVSYDKNPQMICEGGNHGKSYHNKNHV